MNDRDPRLPPLWIYDAYALFCAILGIAVLAVPIWFLWLR